MATSAYQIDSKRASVQKLDSDRAHAKNAKAAASDDAATASILTRLKSSIAADKSSAKESTPAVSPEMQALIDWNTKDKSGKPRFTSEWIGRLQEALGLMRNPDGQFDEATIAAVIEFQSTHTLEPDGKIGNLTRKALEKAYPSITGKAPVVDNSGSQGNSGTGSKRSPIKNMAVVIAWNNKEKVKNPGRYASEIRRFRIDWVGKLQDALGVNRTSDGYFNEDTVNAIADFQADHRLTPDGKIGSGTRRALESAYSILNEKLLGDHLEERILVKSSTPIEARYEYYKSIITKFGGVFNDNAGYMNLLCLRGVDLTGDGDSKQLRQTDSAKQYAEYQQQADAGKASGPVPTHFSSSGADGYNDVMISLWADEVNGKRVLHVSERKGSADPNENGSMGTAHLRDGQYEFKLDKHGTSGDHLNAIKDRFGKNRQDGDVIKVDGNSYTALRANSQIEVIRDQKDKYGKSDRYISQSEYNNSVYNIQNRNSNYVDSSVIQLNIHSSGEHKTDEYKGDVTSSLGCQNVPLDQYNEFIKEIQQRKNGKNGPVVYYTLVDASKISDMDE